MAALSRRHSSGAEVNIALTGISDMLWPMVKKADTSCWVCGSSNTGLKLQGVSPQDLTPENFAITDADYGTTLSLYECGDCGFRFCPDAPDVTDYYRALQDVEYEHTRPQRALQAQRLLRLIRRYKPSGVLLDVGAGSGILVEQAAGLGYRAYGVEPSTWLVAQAHTHGAAVSEGLFPDACADTWYDIITLVDVLEHVNQPLQMLKDVVQHLAPEGIAIIVTPDVASLAARYLGKRWWHYRIAHIGYFSRQTLPLALNAAGLEPVAWHRPSWVFPLDYLLLRLGRYVPLAGKLASLRRLSSVVIPLNLLDSWMVVVKKRS